MNNLVYMAMLVSGTEQTHRTPHCVMVRLPMRSIYRPGYVDPDFHSVLNVVSGPNN